MAGVRRERTVDEDRRDNERAAEADSRPRPGRHHRRVEPRRRDPLQRSGWLDAHLREWRNSRGGHENGRVTSGDRTFPACLPSRRTSVSVLAGISGNRIERKRDSAFALYGFGQVLAAHGDLAAARKRHEGALALRDEIGEEGTAAESRLALAELSIDQGRLAEAQALVQQAADEFRKERETEFEAAAYAIGARSLLAAGKSTEAANTITKANDLMRGTEDREARLLVGIDGARVRAAQGNMAQAIAELQPIVAEAKKYGYLGYELEGRLALAKIEMNSGGGPEARRKLVSLAAEAQAKGFGLIAGKAGVALRR